MFLYRVFNQFADIGWVDFDLGCYPYLPDSAWAGGLFAEAAEQLGKMVEHPKSKSTQPGLVEESQISLFYTFIAHAGVS